MKEKLPQEIEVWDVLPAIRKAFAQIFVHEHRLSQKKTAALLQLTEPAVSQYLQDKRARNLILDESIRNEIKISAKKIISNNALLFRELRRICDLDEVKKVVCHLHRCNNTKIPVDCDVCLNVR